ncbi:hypothetical protein B484DRAFT_398086 [Ochromonadaceae sp. CCMP2298]|nr:hypothetical protein B484DRAFT_398086 [Ochromonadaceae sp. CCMP2298]
MIAAALEAFEDDSQLEEFNDEEDAVQGISGASNEVVVIAQQLLDANGVAIRVEPSLKSTFDAAAGPFDFAFWRRDFLGLLQEIRNAPVAAHEFAFYRVFNVLRCIPESGASKVGAAYATNHFITCTKKYPLVPIESRLGLVIVPGHLERQSDFHLGAAAWGRMNSDAKKKAWLEMLNARLHPSSDSWGPIWRDLLEVLNNAHSSTTVNAQAALQHGTAPADTAVAGVCTQRVAAIVHLFLDRESEVLWTQAGCGPTDRQEYIAVSNTGGMSRYKLSNRNALVSLYDRRKHLYTNEHTETNMSWEWDKRDGTEPLRRSLLRPLASVNPSIASFPTGGEQLWAEFVWVRNRLSEIKSKIENSGTFVTGLDAWGKIAAFCNMGGGNVLCVKSLYLAVYLWYEDMRMNNASLPPDMGTAMGVTLPTLPSQPGSPHADEAGEGTAQASPDALLPSRVVAARAGTRANNKASSGEAWGQMQDVMSGVATTLQTINSSISGSSSTASSGSGDAQAMAAAMAAAFHAVHSSSSSATSTAFTTAAETRQRKYKRKLDKAMWVVSNKDVYADRPEELTEAYAFIAQDWDSDVE